MAAPRPRTRSTGPVTIAHLYDAIEAAVAPLRAEVAAVARDVDAIAKRLNAKPIQRWLYGRVTAVIDKGLPLALVAAFTYLLVR